MPMQINTAKWSPSDALRQRVMGAMEREAQYKNALMKQQEAMRKEIITTEAMRDYNSAVGDPTATRETVYSATQRAIGRIMGVDPEAAKNLAANAANYPKFYPTDLNTSELEAFLNANKDMDRAEAMIEWDKIQVRRKQATMTAAGPLRVMTGPNKESIIIQGKMMYNSDTNQFDRPAPPDIKTVSPQSVSASGQKDVQKNIDEAIKSTAELTNFINERGGIDKVQDAARVFSEFKSAVAPSGKTGDQLQSEFEATPEDNKAKREALASQIVELGKKQAGNKLRDPQEVAAFMDKLRVGSEYVKKRGKYYGMQGVVQQYGKYVDTNDLTVKDLSDGNGPLALQGKYNLDNVEDWSKIAAEPNGKAMIMKHTNKRDPANLIPAAVKYLDAALKKHRASQTSVSSTTSASPRNFVERP